MNGLSLQQRRPLYGLLAEAVPDVIYRLRQARQTLAMLVEESHLIARGGKIADPDPDEPDLSSSAPGSTEQLPSLLIEHLLQIGGLLQGALVGEGGKVLVSELEPHRAGEEPPAPKPPGHPLAEAQQLPLHLSVMRAGVLQEEPWIGACGQLTISAASFTCGETPWGS